MPPEVYTREEIGQLMRGFSRRGSAGIRDCAMTALLYRCGLRVSEALLAPLADLNLTDGTFYVRFPKADRRGRRRPRRVAVDSATMALLERWLARRRSLGINGRSPLFCQIAGERRGLPLASSAYRQSLKRAGSRSGIDKRMHPHGLRHTFAFEWVQEGRPLDHLQVLLGHRQLATTAYYAQHLNPKVALDAQRGREWQVKVAEQTAVSPAQLDEIVQAVLAQIGAA